MRILITLIPGGTCRRKGYFPWRMIQEVAPQIQEVAPTDSRGGPHNVRGMGLWSVWHFGLCGEWILEVAPTNSRGGPHHVCDVTLWSMWHLVSFRIRRTLAWSRDTSSSSWHHACSAGRWYGRAINKSNSVGNMSTWDTEVQECKS